MQNAELDDNALIRRIKQKDETALSLLYDRYNRLVYSVVWQTIGNTSLAEEITLDVFWRVWDKAEQYDSERAQVNTWLTSIARYRAIDQLRRESSRPEKQAIQWAKVVREPDPFAINPENSTQLTLQKEQVQTAVQQLPNDQQEVIGLAFFKGYSHREIADLLNEPLGTIKWRIRTGMKKLRGLLKQEKTHPLI